MGRYIIAHWVRVTHICVSKLTIIGSDNGLSSDRRQAIIWINAGILSIGPLGTNFSEILIKILTLSFKKMRLKVSSAKRRPFCLGLNVLTESLHSLTVKTYAAVLWTITIPDSKVHGANMGAIWGRQDPGGPHVGPMNFVISDPIIEICSQCLARVIVWKAWIHCMFSIFQKILTENWIIHSMNMALTKTSSMKYINPYMHKCNNLIESSVMDQLSLSKRIAFTLLCHINFRSLNRNLAISYFRQGQLDSSFLGFSETFLRDDNYCELYGITGYSICEKHKHAVGGGVAISVVNVYIYIAYTEIYYISYFD